MCRVLQKIRQYDATLGFPGIVVLLAGLLFAKLPLWLFPKSLRQHRLKMRLPGIRHPVIVRFGTTDVWVVKQVLLDRQYDFSLPIVPKVIVDAGANIGLSAVFFANKYPDAVILALEPEESNFKLLAMNASAYPQIKPLMAALWGEDTQISLVDPGFGDWGFLTGEANRNKGRSRGLVQAFRLDTLMKNAGVERIDVLKIDIEGAEKEVFESSEKWMDKVQVVMAELHDELKSGCGKAFSEATRGFHEEPSDEETVVRWRATTA